MAAMIEQSVASNGVVGHAPAFVRHREPTVKEHPPMAVGVDSAPEDPSAQSRRQVFVPQREWQLPSMTVAVDNAVLVCCCIANAHDRCPPSTCAATRL